MAEPLFNPGDVVQLKSGGPAMTVDSIIDRGKTIECTWFDEKRQLQHAQFSPAVLEPYEP